LSAILLFGYHLRYFFANPVTFYEITKLPRAICSINSIPVSFFAK